MAEHPPAAADTNADGDAPSLAHETADVDGPRIWQTAAVLAAVIVAAGFAGYGVLTLFRHETGRALSPIDALPAHMASPPLQNAPARDLAALRAQKRAMLNEYRWIDRDKGIVRIPIERAMSLLIARSPAPAQ